MYSMNHFGIRAECKNEIDNLVKEECKINVPTDGPGMT